MYISASFPCINWLEAIGMPNCFLSCVYGKEMSRAACMIPRGPEERTRRSKSRPSIRTCTPRFMEPSIFEEGTKTSENTSSPVLDPLMPSLSSLRATLNPVVEESTMNAVIPLEPAEGSVLAYTIM